MRRVGLAIVLILLAMAPAEPARARFAYELEGGREATLFAAGAIVGGAHLLVQSRQTPLDQAQLDALEVGDVPRLDRIATRSWSPVAARTSDVLSYGLLASPLSLVLAGEGRNQPDVVLAMYAQTLLANSACVQLLKGLTHRTRPYAYNRDPRIAAGLRRSKHAVRSFPSGHAANAFGSAVFLGVVHGRLHPDSRARPWIWTLSLAGAAATGALRVVSGDHFVSDVLAGSVVGAAAGALIPRLHEWDEGASGTAATPMVSFGFRF